MFDSNYIKKYIAEFFLGIFAVIILVLLLISITIFLNLKKSALIPANIDNSELTLPTLNAATYQKLLDKKK